MSNLHLTHHLGLGSSMVRASHWSTEGCGFDPHLWLRNHFLRIELDDLSSLLTSDIIGIWEVGVFVIIDELTTFALTVCLWHLCHSSTH